MLKNNLIKKWAKDLFPLNRSLAGKYNRMTLNYIKKISIKDSKLKKLNPELKLLLGLFQKNML